MSTIYCSQVPMHQTKTSSGNPFFTPSPNLVQGRGDNRLWLHFRKNKPIFTLCVD